MFTKAKIADIRKDIDAALAAVGAKHRIKLEIGRITYTDNSFTTKLTANNTDENGNKIIPSFRLPPGFNKSIVGATITVGLDTLRVVGIKRTKFEVEIIGRDGKYVIPIESVRSALLAQKSEHVSY